MYDFGDIFSYFLQYRQQYQAIYYIYIIKITFSSLAILNSMGGILQPQRIIQPLVSKIDYKEIGQEYKKLTIQQNFPKIERLYFQNSTKELNSFAYWLYNKNIKFTDKIVPYQKLMPQYLCKWKRAEQVFEGEKYKNPNWNFQYQLENQNRYSNNQELKAVIQRLKQLKKQGRSLLEEICLHRQQSIFNPGMYRFMFCLAGKKETEVVVDSFIPIDNFGRYLFDQPKKGGGIWSILLVKALAKVVGSYLKLKQLTKQQILSQIIGYPSHTDFFLLNVINTYPITLKGRSQIYFKIGNTEHIDFNLYFWFHLKADKTQKYKEVDFAKDSLIVQIYEPQKSQSYLCQKIQTQKFQSQRHQNLLKIKAKQADIIQIKEKGTVIYFFNLSRSDITCNLVIQSNLTLIIKQSTANEELSQCRMTKLQALKNQYNKIHNQLESFDFSQYKVRCYWKENRGVLCLKNTQPYRQTFSLQIKQKFRQSILLQDKQGEYSTEYQVQPNNHCLFILKRVKIKQQSIFYTIKSRRV